MEKCRPLLIVPAYNEEATIAEVIEGIRKEGFDYVVVNDGSTDSTLSICRENGFDVIDLPVNLGLAGAFQTGMLYACRHGYDCAVQFDADKQHRPEYVPALIEAIADNDIVIGSRFVDRKKPRTLRMAGSRLISFAIKLTTGRTIKDPTSGMRCFNRRTMELLASGINVGPEPDTLAYLIRSAHARVREVQVTVDERSAGKSYLNMKTSVAYMVRILLSVLFIQFFRKKLGKSPAEVPAREGSPATTPARPSATAGAPAAAAGRPPAPASATASLPLAMSDELVGKEALWTTELRIVLVIASFVTAALMLRRIRRSKVRIEDSVFWIGLSTVILVVSIFPQIADACAAALHIYETTNFLFLFFIFVLLVKLFTMSVHVSQLESKLDRAVQEQALGAKELEEKTERDA